MSPNVPNSLPPSPSPASTIPEYPRQPRTLMAILKQLSFTFKVNFVMFAVLSLLLLTILWLVTTNIHQLTNETGDHQIRQEVEILQNQLVRVQQELRSSTMILAATPDLLQSVKKRDIPSAESLILISTTRFDFDDVDITDDKGKYLLDWDKTPRTELEQQLIQTALLGIPAMQALFEEEAQELWLFVGMPLRDQGGTIIGSLLISRHVNSALLDAMNFSRQHVHLLCIEDNNIIAHSKMNEQYTTTAEFSLDREAIEQTMAGKPAITDHLITINAVPYAIAYVPLLVNDKAQGIIGIMVEMEELARFETQIITNLMLVFSLLGLLALAAMAFFIRQHATRPLWQLQQGAEKLMGGDYAQRVVVRSHDEFGRLAAAFNRMAEAVQEREEELHRLALSLQERNEEIRSQSEERARLQEEVISIQAETLRKLSTPLIPISEQVIALPLIGDMDEERAERVIESLLHGIEQQRVRVAILDVTGVTTIDQHVVSTMMQGVQAVRLLGAQMILTGIGPRMAEMLIRLDVDWRNLVTRNTLQEGIAYASTLR